jgi:hypothetical protein
MAKSYNGVISTNPNWQHVSFNVNMGTGYDWVLICIGQSLNADGVTDLPLKLGVDNVSFATIDSAAVQALNPLSPSTIDVTPSTINFNWRLVGDLVIKDYEFVLTTDPNLANDSAWMVAPTTVLPQDPAPALPTAPQSDPNGFYLYDNDTDFPYGTTYYWAVSANVFEPNDAYKLQVPEPNSVYNIPGSFSARTFTFSTVSASPIVDAGDDDYDWLEGATGTYTLNAIVTDIDTPIENITLLWTVDVKPDGSTASVVPDNSLNGVLTFDTAGDYTLTLSADDGENAPVTDSVVITVYADECAAAKAENGYGQGVALFRGDATYDCIVNLDDLARVSEFWLFPVTGK